VFLSRRSHSRNSYAVEIKIYTPEVSEHPLSSACFAPAIGSAVLSSLPSQRDTFVIRGFPKDFKTWDAPGLLLRLIAVIGTPLATFSGISSLELECLALA
jgi:hypothetical protein